MRTSIAAAMLAASLVAQHASAQSQAVIVRADEVKWANAGIAGVSTAVVEGDLIRGASKFYLRYAAGFVAPVHYHSTDHRVTTVSGSLVLIVDGKEHRVAPGSYFALLGRQPHAARCEGSQDCVMFIDARAPWDVVAVQQ